MSLNQFSYAITKDGLYCLSPVDKLWYSTSQKDVEALLAGDTASYEHFSNEHAYAKANRLSDPIAVSRSGDVTTVSSESTTLQLSRDTLHRLLWLVQYREGPSGWGAVRKAFEAVGISVSSNELNVRRFIHALAFPELIADMR